MQETTRRIAEKWGQELPLHLLPGPFREAAVMICLTENRDGETAVLFEVRAHNLHRQPGEVSLPGGSVEAGEDPLTAAIRETQEELLIDKSQVHVLAPLGDLLTVPGDHLHAYVAALDGYSGSFSSAEVDHVFTVPLSYLLRHAPRCASVEVERVPGADFPYELIPGGRSYHLISRKIPMYFYTWPGEKAAIWGMTASVLHAFLERYRKDFGEGQTEP